MSWAFFGITLCLGFYKVYRFNLPHWRLEFEILLLFLVHFWNQVRLFIGLKSNKLEKAHACSIISYYGLSLLVILGFIFFLLMQTYTLLIEFIVVGIALLMTLLELIFITFAFVEFKSMENSQ